EGEHRARERIHADVDRRLEHDILSQPVARKGRPEAAIQEPARGVLLLQLSGLDEAIGEMRSIRAESHGADHAVAVEPMLVTEVAAAESSRTVHVVSPAQRRRDGSAYARHRIRILDGVEKETALETDAHADTIS